MKKMKKILLGLLLIPSIALTGCLKDEDPVDVPPPTQEGGESGEGSQTPAAPTTLNETEAATAYSAAITAMLGEDNLEISQNMGLMGNMTLIQTPTMSYSNAMGAEIWTVEESGVDYDYMIYEFDTMKIYTKMESDPENSMVMDMEEMVPENAEFVSGTVENGITTLVYSVSEDGVVSLETITITNGKITKVHITDEDGIALVIINLKYGSEVSIPPLPTHDENNEPIVWEEE